MNLAEIRKKAQKDRKHAGTAPEEEIFTFPDPTPAELPPEDDVPAPPDDLPKPVPETVEELAGLKPEEARASFDLLALILAGRQVSAEDETESEMDTKDTDTSVFQEFLCFRVSNETYAINIMDIKEIIKPREVTEVPRVPSYISGVLSLRGIIIPIFNMRERLGLPSAETSPKERIVVIKKGEEFRGITVDEVIQVVRIPAGSIEPPPPVLDALDRDFVSGIGRHEQMMLILLNLDKILDVNLCQPM